MRGRHIAIACVVAAGIAALVLIMVWPHNAMGSRDLGCTNVTPGRGESICQALSESMEWTWMGHAIISPGWRLTWSGLRRVYCHEKVGVADLAALGKLKMGSDWRLQDGADDLIRLVDAEEGRSQEPENSIFNRANPQYILKGGCGGDQ